MVTRMKGKTLVATGATSGIGGRPPSGSRPWALE